MANTNPFTLDAGTAAQMLQEAFQEAGPISDSGSFLKRALMSRAFRVAGRVVTAVPAFLFGNVKQLLGWIPETPVLGKAVYHKPVDWLEGRIAKRFNDYTLIPFKTHADDSVRAALQELAKESVWHHLRQTASGEQKYCDILSVISGKTKGCLSLTASQRENEKYERLGTMLDELSESVVQSSLVEGEKEELLEGIQSAIMGCGLYKMVKDNTRKHAEAMYESVLWGVYTGGGLLATLKGATVAAQLLGGGPELLISATLAATSILIGNYGSAAGAWFAVTFANMPSWTGDAPLRLTQDMITSLMNNRAAMDAMIIVLATPLAPLVARSNNCAMRAILNYDNMDVARLGLTELMQKAYDSMRRYGDKNLPLREEVERFASALETGTFNESQTQMMVDIFSTKGPISGERVDDFMKGAKVDRKIAEAMARRGALMNPIVFSALKMALATALGQIQKELERMPTPEIPERLGSKKGCAPSSEPGGTTKV